MTNRYLRQLEIFDPAEYPYGVNIVGTGGIGSALGIAMVKCGFTDFILWDADNVEEHNLGSQLFPENVLGTNKAQALSIEMKRINSVNASRN